MKEDVRYLAKWLLAARPGGMRVQVFGGEGSFLADMFLSGDSLAVLLPQEMECYSGAADELPLGDLLGLEIDWNGSLTGLSMLFWPCRGQEVWIPGRLGRRVGWFQRETGIFLEPDPEELVPKYLIMGEGDSLIIIRTESFTVVDGGFYPSRIAFEWPTQDSRMWLEIEKWNRGDVGDEALRIPCP